MPNVLMFADTLRSAELRHEVPLGIGDPFLYAEVDGERHVVISQLESSRVDDLGLGLELHLQEEFGGDELRRQGLDRDEIQRRIALGFCERYGIADAVVPDTFPVRMADALRAAGIDLSPVPSSSPTGGGRKHLRSSRGSSVPSERPAREWTP